MITDKEKELLDLLVEIIAKKLLSDNRTIEEIKEEFEKLDQRANELRSGGDDQKDITV